ncbi:uncharacterized protein V1510DRAFT_409647 [Dipodascopsis tothii]|uniref:uncharacterized protein n=1 Tax=Dipodascopsis tothii TaxID=44089 RepID=UPI0034CFAD8A
MPSDNPPLLTAEEVRELGERTLAARELSYCRYSHFKVGAVIYTDKGEFVEGANVENASYGACICAEQTAVTKAITSRKFGFRAIGVASSAGTTTPPCGICRQVLREFAPNILIYMFDEHKNFVMDSLDSMLPRSFGPEDLI